MVESNRRGLHSEAVCRRSKLMRVQCSRGRSRVSKSTRVGRFKNGAHKRASTAVEQETQDADDWRPGMRADYGMSRARTQPVLLRSTYIVVGTWQGGCVDCGPS